MKLTLLLTLFLFSSFNSFAELTESHVYADAELGDVVFSYLDEANFRKLHSTDWVQLNGATNVEKTELCSLLASQGMSCQLANFLGKFLRVSGGSASGVGIEQPFNTAMPVKEFNITTYTAGEHAHSFDYNGGFGDSGATVGGSHMANNNTKATTNGGAHYHTGNVTGGGDAETRPTNIALYAYIRVNTTHSQAKVTANLRSEVSELKTEVSRLKRRFCVRKEHDEGASAYINCYARLITDFNNNAYYMAKDEISRVVFDLQAIVCEGEASEEQTSLFTDFIGDYGACEISCR